MTKVYAKKSLGQNFLVDRNYIRRVISSVSPDPGDTIVEIGPGRGALTEHLVASGAQVIAIELDNELADILDDRFSGSSNFKVVQGNAIEIDLSKLISPNTKAKLVANLPYYISTAILQHFIKQREHLSELVLMFQKEVVERITAEPGSSERGYLTVLVGAAFEVEKLFYVPPAAFRPVPKVQSSVVRLLPKPFSIADTKGFTDLISFAFAHKRKTLTNNLRVAYKDISRAFAAANIDGQRRAETLTHEEWTRLLSHLGREM
ncbi:16S rRNA (adenine(1518)-N(6)/adenine(1519)-N(6))-dimethyltransferase RsmA [Leptolyngbya sp. 7M]|uniref:16S rRNA (adenine(1518)-N(6)/adenine(1519)-N(6))- dimethyltransferase RsmA n=1 Tax=Leptolyngbya sp. 7M TaxID=2812896 RepID=UPI001B8CDE14|nr:16S rRNA (adenine(1518)-N(6)/adenine(1519)-N(6))-dimethyltransferase RsmA [Leptolyngbya sp. 7M]QYO66039.1 16S rRNA (adenine(1518)-N(6)/adenine(1519)-N(6))-dimethyltransferase RsmA [Leptolyngbya sp. 7M]